MESIFNASNLIYWALLCLIIYAETKLLTNHHDPPYPKKWPEPKRWWLGLATLFGLSLIMVVAQSWDFWTWLGLLLSVLLSREIKPHLYLVGNLWQRPNRECHRWSVTYFAAFLLCIPGVAIGVWDVSTWVAMFFALGLCGASKVGFEAYLHSLKAEELRQKPQEVKENGPTA